MSPSQSVTELLSQLSAGDSHALDELMPLVYDTLKRLSARQLRGEAGGHTLQTTALVHEAYERLVGTDVVWQDRAHFFAVAARTMRRVLLDHAKAKRRQKRGGDLVRVTLDEASALALAAPQLDLLALDQALTRLARLDDRKAQVVELYFFGGLSYEEIGYTLRISAATVDRELRFAKAWLYRALAEANGSE